MAELAFDFCQHKGPRGGACGDAIALGILTGEWFHRSGLAWTFPPKQWDHQAVPSDKPRRFETKGR